MARTNIRGSQIADGSNGVDLAVDVTGLLPVGNGGTGLANPTAGRFLVGNGTSVIDLSKIVPTGAVLGTTDAQVVTNKDLTSTTNTFPPQPRKWSSATAYAVGDSVGYAGGIYRCLATPTTGIPPALQNSKWEVVVSPSLNVWPETDPWFDGDTLSNSYQAFWTGGTVTSIGFTSTAGEFESGKQALKISLAVSSAQRLYPLTEGLVEGGERVQIQVRAKMLSGAGGQLVGDFFQCNTGNPEPFGGGDSSNIGAPPEGTQNLTTSWATYTFTYTAVNAKPRATAEILAQTGAGSTAVILIDWFKINRLPASTMTPTGAILEWAGLTAPTGYMMCDNTAVSRTAYAALFNAITSAPFTATGASGQKVVSTATASASYVGMVLDAPGIPAGNVIASAVAGVSYTLTNNITVTLTGTLNARLTPWGNGDGSTTFNVPDKRGKVGVGVDATTEFFNLNTKFGEKAHILTIPELATHGHALAQAMHLSSAESSGFGLSASSSFTNRVIVGGAPANTEPATAGSNTAHNNIQPSVAMNYIVKT